MQKIIRYRFGGHLGNRMFECMLAHSLAVRIPGLAIAGPTLQEWGLRAPTKLLPPRDLAAKLFPAGLADGTPTTENALVISIRGTEILGARHPAYRPLPLAFYEG